MFDTDAEYAANAIGPMQYMSIEEGRAFDEAAERIFASIPEIDRVLHAGKLVFIAPYADPSKGPLYVFGVDLREVLRVAKEQFGHVECGELMSLATLNGRVPKEALQDLRGR